MQYEIEIKSLLGTKERSNELLEAIKHFDSSTRLVGTQKQLNHYFKNGSLADIASALSNYLSDEECATLDEITQRAKSINVRSRKKNDDVLIVVKGSLDDTSAVHSHQRMEFETVLDMSIEELDAKIISAGWELEAKWQADREIFTALGITIDFFFTPGYGYLVEFERVVHSDEEREHAHSELVSLMQKLSVEELANERLERMFAYYNQHWQQYYGTSKVFTIL